MDDRHVEEEESEMSEPDRISELPNSLIHSIFSYLEMKEIVKTTTLSKRWNNVWTTLPYLHFQSRSYSIWGNSNRNNNIWADADYLHAFRTFVNGALSQWKGTKIMRFSLDFMFDISIATDLDSWLAFAVDKQVEELSVKLAGLKVKLYCWESEYYVPDCVFSCSSITDLCLVSCKLWIGAKGVRWSQLQSLYVEGNDSLIIAPILCGAPRLELLNVRVVESRRNLKVVSTSVKTLKVDRFMLDVMEDTTLTVSAPNLEVLEVSGVSFCTLSLDAPCLTTVNLGFHNRDNCIEEESGCENVSVDNMLMRVFLSILGVEELTLSASCLKILGQLKKKDEFVEFPNIKFLKLYISAAEDVLVVLTTLVLQLENRQSHLIRYTCRKACNLFEHDPSFSTCPLPFLSTVDVTWHSYDTSIVPIIEHLLEKGCTLQKMVFRCRLFSDEDKMLSLPRSSPNAEVIIIKDPNE